MTADSSAVQSTNTISCGAAKWHSAGTSLFACRAFPGGRPPPVWIMGENEIARSASMAEHWLRIFIGCHVISGRRIVSLSVIYGGCVSKELGQ